MKHFAPAPINDDRDHWLIRGDGCDCMLLNSEADVYDYVRNYDKWWTQILMINSSEDKCRDVTEDFSDDEPEDDRAYGDRRFQDARDRLGRTV